MCEELEVEENRPVNNDCMDSDFAKLMILFYGDDSSELRTDTSVMDSLAGSPILAKKSLMNG